MQILSILSKPLVGGLIGLFTNWLALFMLFHPYREKKIGRWKIPFTPGMIPKRKEKIAKAVGEAVGKEILGKEELTKILTDEKVILSIETITAQKVKNCCFSLRDEEVVSFLADIILAQFSDTALFSLGTQTRELLRKKTMQCLQKRWESIKEKRVQEVIPCEKIITFYKRCVPLLTNSVIREEEIALAIERKIDEMDIRQIDKLCRRVVQKEMNAVVWLGGILGMLIGALSIFL